MNIPDSARSQHVYIAGKTRHGKSTLIHAMAYQDIKRGSGVCVIDPKGDLVSSLINWIPEKRVPDTILLDFVTPVPLDFMSYKTDDEKEVLVGDLIYILDRFTQHAPRMTAILRDLTYTLLDAGNCTFLDIYRFLVDGDRRRDILKRVKDADLRRRWNDRFPTQDSLEPILSRMTTFVRTPSLRAIFGATSPKLNIEEAMNSRKVILVNLGGLSESKILYGSLLVSKIQQAAFRRHAIREQNRVPFLLYVDEFQNFKTSSFDQILSVAGGFKLCLTLAHQFVDQIDEQTRHAILGNVSTFFLFRLHDNSARYFKGEIPSLAKEKVWKRSPESGEMEWMDRPRSFDPSQLTTLPPGRCLYRAVDGSAKFITTPLPPPEPKHSFAEIIKKRTKELYSCALPVEYLVSKEEEIRPSAPPKRLHGAHHRPAKKDSAAVS